jgi:hypothetical protein
MKHICNNCNFETTILSKYLRHVQTDKHKQKIETIKKEEDTIKKIASMETNVINNINEVKNDLEKKITKEADKNNKKITAKIEEVKKIANKNKEYAKSTLTILNELYKDNPPLEYPGDRQCLTALYEYYKLSRLQVMNTNKLQKALIKDYTNGTLLDTIIKILTTFLKKDNLHLQSIFNTDTSRHHYAAKYTDSWEKDKAGKYLSDKVVKPFCEIIKALMINYKQYKNKRYKEYKKKLLNKDKNSESDDDIFMNANETETEFAYKDDTSDEDRRGIDDLDELCSINKLGRYIESGCLYDEIIAKLSTILNYNVRIKKN